MKGRLLGIDFGMARIGVALSDPTRLIASPLTTLKNKGKMDLILQEVKELIQKHEVKGIVVGMPYHFDGAKGASAKEVEKFIKALEEGLSIEVFTWDERLTTQQTERIMKEGNMRRKKRAQVIDAACATLILQSYLDHKRF